MKLPSIRRTSTAGLWIATVGSSASRCANGLGRVPQNELEQIGLRHLHLAMAIILIVLAGIDVVSNG
jgi:hypothetical protein